MDVWVNEITDGVATAFRVVNAQYSAIGIAALTRLGWKNAEALRQGQFIMLSFGHAGRGSNFRVRLRVDNKCRGDMQLSKDDYERMGELFLKAPGPSALMLKSNKKISEDQAEAWRNQRLAKEEKELREGDKIIEAKRKEKKAELSKKASQHSTTN